MKKLLILLALVAPTVARANTVTPQFTTGSMNSTTTTTQTITEVEQRQVFGSNTANPWTLETTTRAAGLVEQWDTTTNYTINSTTTSLSVFSQ